MTVNFRLFFIVSHSLSQLMNEFAYYAFYKGYSVAFLSNIRESLFIE